MTGNTPVVSVRNLSAFYGGKRVLDSITMDFMPNTITAVIGRSGSGKSTLVRCINRLHQSAGGHTEGIIRFRNEDVLAMDVIDLRSQIGMVFQKPNPFPHLSVGDNVLAGYKLNSGSPPPGTTYEEIVFNALNSVAMWDEVKDKLKDSGTALSGGQQQRLCIARAIALKPDVLLMDEPCSALDPISTEKIEELMCELQQQYTIILVTHDMDQARSVASHTGFLQAGRLIEFGVTAQIFDDPEQEETKQYVKRRR